MTYINKSLVLAGLNLRLLRLKNEHENVDKIAELENIIGAISETETEDVIERSEYDELHKKYLKAIHNHTECLKELHEYRSKVDKAFKELQNMKVYERTRTARLVSLPEVLDILKKNIGE